MINPHKWLAPCWVVMVLFLQAGCKQTQASREQDPLVGGVPLSKAATTGNPLTPPLRGPQATLAAGEPPPIPPIPTTSSPAALTVGNVNPRTGGRYQPLATLHEPRPSVSAQEGKAAPTQSTSQTQTDLSFLSYEQLQQQLLQRGVVWQRLQCHGGDDWHFICAIPRPDQPELRTNYEAFAHGPLGLAAIRAVIRKIDQQSR